MAATPNGPWPTGIGGTAGFIRRRQVNHRDSVVVEIRDIDLGAIRGGSYAKRTVANGDRGTDFISRCVNHKNLAIEGSNIGMFPIRGDSYAKREAADVDRGDDFIGRRRVDHRDRGRGLVRDRQVSHPG